MSIYAIFRHKSLNHEYFFHRKTGKIHPRSSCFWNYKNASEVVREALRLHNKENDRKLEWFRTEIQKKIDSGISDMSIDQIFEEPKKKLCHKRQPIENSIY